MVYTSSHPTRTRRRANMVMIDLSTLLDDDTNLVECYICPKKVDLNHDVRCAWSTAMPQCIDKGAFGKGNSSHLHEFHHRDMVCVYDRENDGQRVVRKSLIRESCVGNLYMAASVEEVLPSHRFPCTKEMTMEMDIVRTAYRINNRMFLYHDHEVETYHGKEGAAYEYLYVRYQHAPNVDLSKMQDDLNRAIHKLRA